MLDNGFNKTNQYTNQSESDMKTSTNKEIKESSSSNNKSLKTTSVGKSYGIRSFGLLIASLVILLDQGSKWLVTETFEYGETLAVFQSFALTLRYNTGAAFSFLADASGWQRWFFVAVAAIVSSIIFIWLGRLSKENKTEALGLALILGGALGNVIDRLLHGYVVDFLLVYYKEWQFPAFNIADAAINLGVFFVILSMFKRKT
jgi:signal peptidase II